MMMGLVYTDLGQALILAVSFCLLTIDSILALKSRFLHVVITC